jgi:flagellar biosynthetic protein FlhB
LAPAFPSARYAGDIVAETDSGQERTEDATSKRQEKAREDGQVARSRELNTMFVLLAGVGGLMMFGHDLGTALLEQMRFNFTLPREVGFDTHLVTRHFWDSTLAIGGAMLPLFILLMIAALAGPISLGGWLFSASALQFKGSRIDPLQGLKRMFSVTALVELFKALIKFLLLAGIAVAIVAQLQQSLLQLGLQTLQAALADALWMSAWAVFGVSSGMIVIALIDVPYQLFDHGRKLKMTKQEVREEMKDSEGKPEVKSRIRQLQREMARRRMMEAVPDADVVITNPDHFSVALRYDPVNGGAPTLVAKGVDVLALKIREIATAHGVQQLPAPTLARAIYFTTELDQEIPAPLYLAVAQVLAYVFQLKTYRDGKGGRKPKPIGELPVPAEMVFDQRGQRAGP